MRNEEFILRRTIGHGCGGEIRLDIATAVWMPYRSRLSHVTIYLRQKIIPTPIVILIFQGKWQYRLDSMSVNDPHYY